VHTALRQQEEEEQHSALNSALKDQSFSRRMRSLTQPTSALPVLFADTQKGVDPAFQQDR
jgi:hypothetical protein